MMRHVDGARVREEKKYVRLFVVGHLTPVKKKKTHTATDSSLQARQ